MSGTSATATEGRVFTILGFVFAGLAVVILPILFGPAGIVMGIVGHSKGDPRGKLAAILAGVGMILGFIVGVALLASLRGGTS